MGGALNGKLNNLWVTIAEHIHEHKSDMKVLTSKSVSLSRAVAGDFIKPRPGIDTPSASKPKAPSNIGNTIYYTLTKIITQGRDNVKFSSLKSWVS